MHEEQAKGQAGAEASAESHAEELAAARLAAAGLAVTGQDVTIDDVRAKLERDGVKYTSGNWLGQVFKGWVAVGVARSEHKGSRGRLIRKWRPKWSGEQK